ncbi:MAG: hypothetical protein JSV96_01975 [Candidatus Aminicenantes bacterium]|nr:MAG: hypothetical protein JSV96_01975 [Candidatus Aminicenantes bacterium]
MISKTQKNMKRFTLILVFFLLLMSSDIVILEAEEETRSCNEAFMACVDDGPSIWFAWLGQASYCFVGWVFCKKYVESRD